MNGIEKIILKPHEHTRYFLATKLNLCENTYRKRIKALGIKHRQKLTVNEVKMIIF